MPGRPGRPTFGEEAVCRVVVYIEPRHLAWLRGLESESLVSGRRLGSSAVVRLALDGLMAGRPTHRELRRRIEED